MGNKCPLAPCISFFPSVNCAVKKTQNSKTNNNKNETEIKTQFIINPYGSLEIHISSLYDNGIIKSNTSFHCLF